MSGDQLFIIGILTAVFTGISSIVGIFAAYLTTKVRAEAAGHQIETRQNIGELAKAVNGAKSEVVAAVKTAAMQEGAKLESERSLSPAADQRAIDRYAEVAQESTDASAAATLIAGQAEKHILEIPADPAGKTGGVS